MAIAGAPSAQGTIAWVPSALARPPMPPFPRMTLTPAPKVNPAPPGVSRIGAQRRFHLGGSVLSIPGRDIRGDDDVSVIARPRGFSGPRDDGRVHRRGAAGRGLQLGPGTRSRRGRAGLDIEGGLEAHILVRGVRESHRSIRHDGGLSRRGRSNGRIAGRHDGDAGCRAGRRRRAGVRQESTEGKVSRDAGLNRLGSCP